MNNLDRTETAMARLGWARPSDALAEIAKQLTRIADALERQAPRVITVDSPDPLTKEQIESYRRAFAGAAPARVQSQRPTEL